MPDLVAIDRAGADVPDATDDMTGTLLAWRWLDQEAGDWQALVRFQGGRVSYEQWIPGRHLRRLEWPAEPI